MGLFEPNIENKAVNSQASPLAGDLLDMLRKQLTGGAFGEGFGPNKELGTHARQFFESLKSGGANQLRDIPTIEELAPAITARHEQGIAKGAADLREGMGVAGSRFGSAAARGEGTLRAEGQTGLDAMLAGLTKELAGMGVQRDIAQNEQVMQGLMSLFGMNQANQAPFWQMGGMGILPENTVVSDTGFTTFLQTVAELGKVFKPGPGG